MDVFSGVGLLIQILVIGLVAGYLAALVMKERRFGLLGFTIVGIIGSFIGTYLFELVNLPIGRIEVGPVKFGHLIAAFLGAIVLILLLRLFRGHRRR